jgi:hypothetical protein
MTKYEPIVLNKNMAASLSLSNLILAVECAFVYFINMPKPGEAMPLSLL